MKRKIIIQIHLWLGLASGLVVLFLGITGCILSFQREIENATQPYRFVEERNAEMLAPSVLKGIGKAQLPGKHLHAVLYDGKTHAAQVIFFQFEPESYYHVVYVNPYDGQVLKVKDMDKDFFRVVTMGHYYLWLPEHIGQPIVASATLVFVILMITGLILWWPRNKAARKQRFTIKWGATWKRRNYDLHNVLGFYMTWIAIILACTGLVMGFQWFAKSVHGIAGGEKQLEYAEPFSDTTKPSIDLGGLPVMDVVWHKMKKEYPTAEIIEVHDAETPLSPIAANANPDRETYWQTDYRYFDQYTMEELPVNHVFGRYKDAVTADKIIRMNYDIHTGAILGLPGKILMFCASLIAASLPVTGFYIWWGKRKKKKSQMRMAKVVVIRQQEVEAVI
ncbi:PepSY-associated TM helix domain-containing protein [Aridibaculum aurantiacum]|uniref:PepSY-associated TM helix domain-containing protein n=1 Tax=Aridibaculum aurantiacum TaxID=2810307 RepID=UPI001A969965|nr:PepSY-associated TM helix domain-containing protein [Aridibaculum aurantiacum]